MDSRRQDFDYLRKYLGNLAYMPLSLVAPLSQMLSNAVLGIRVLSVYNVRDLPSCTLSTSYNMVWRLSDLDATTCVQAFPNRKTVNWFVASILLPATGIHHYQVGVLLTSQIQCDGPELTVINDPYDCGGATRPLHQCMRQPRYDGFRVVEPQIRRCAFHCLNESPSNATVKVAVQLVQLPWLYLDVDSNGIEICGIEAYTFW